MVKKVRKFGSKTYQIYPSKQQLRGFPTKTKANKTAKSMRRHSLARVVKSGKRYYVYSKRKVK